MIFFTVSFSRFTPLDFRTKSGKRPIKVGKRPIKEGKRPIKAMVLVGSSVGCLMGCFRAPPLCRKTAPEVYDQHASTFSTHSDTKAVPAFTAFANVYWRNPNGYQNKQLPKCLALRFQNQESPQQTKPKKGPKRKVHEFRPFFCEFWCFSLGRQARFTFRTFVPECPCEKFMN